METLIAVIWSLFICNKENIIIEMDHMVILIYCVVQCYKQENE